MATRRRAPSRSRSGGARARGTAPGMRSGKSRSGVKNRYYRGGEQY